jgi:predicted kinase
MMPRLVLINGAPGAGKSTLARRYAHDHPQTLVLDIDQVRGMLGRWKESPTEAGILARRMAVEMARVHLLAGYDVLVPQFLGRIDFVLTLQELCDDLGVPFVEVALLSSADESIARFTHRSASSPYPEHRDAADLVREAGGVDELRTMYERLLDVVSSRPATTIIHTEHGRIDRAYADLLARLSRE